ncbi:MAG: tetratricopeptide repeat protein [Bacteroidetes bacterium]|jgi:tetratricopeptide (TPR) repeat protein/uncharacterized membrane protein|nr:tetratricopeptide repeat protein [Bacteroidota bacterium]
MKKSPPPEHTDTLFLYCFNTAKIKQLTNILSGINVQNTRVFAAKELEEKLHKKDSITFVSRPEFCRLLQEKETQVILLDITNIEHFNTESWIKKCKGNVAKEEVLFASKKPGGFKQKFTSELRYAFTGRDLSETLTPSICISSVHLLPVLEKSTSLSTLIRELRKIPELHFTYLEQEYKADKPPALLKETGTALLSAFNRNFTAPLRKSECIQPAGRSNNISRFIFNCLLLLLFFLMPVLSQDFGITGDEVLHHGQAGLVQDYFDTGNKAALDQPKTLLHLYGQSFDLFCLKVINLLDTEKIYETRHVLISLAGYLCILFISLTTLRLAGYKAAIGSVLLTVFTPAFFGHCMNNSIDIPFALAFAGTIYYLTLQVQTYPKIRLSHCFMLICLIAFGISVRAGGLLLIFYLLMTYGLIYLKTTGLRNFYRPGEFKRHYKLFLIGTGICITAYFLGLLYWPYALQAPLVNPVKALTHLTSIRSSLKQLFEGQRIFSVSLPAHYLSKFMLITIPLVVLAGLLFFLLFVYRKLKENFAVYILLLFSIVFPIVYAAISHANIYSSWRHFLFVYPGIVILSALGWNCLRQFSGTLLSKIAVLLLFFAALALPFRFMIANHPYEYVYFNEFVGGINKAWKKYETDYYSGSLKQAASWLKNEPEFKNRKDTVTIATTLPAVVSYYLKDEPNIKIVYTRYYDRSDIRWDYALFYLEHIHPFQLQNGLWPPAETIYSVKADNATLGTVLKNKSDEDYLGIKAYKTGKNDEAILHFLNYLKLVPGSEFALNGIANACLNKKEYTNAIRYAEEALLYNPDYVYALQTRAISNIQLHNNTSAITDMVFVTTNDPNYGAGHYYLSIAYLFDKQFEKAVEHARHSLKLDPSLTDAYRILSLAYSSLGETENAKECADLFYKKSGKTRPAQSSPSY